MASIRFRFRLRFPRAGLLPALAVAAGCLLATPAAVAQRNAGQVTHLQGMATAQQGPGNYRFLGQGDVVQEGDTVSTTERGFAVVTLADGTRFTMRPASTFTVERFEQAPGAEAMLLRLLKGGVRVVTGLVGKANPKSVEVRTPTATIGIRGTSFDARVCAADCRAEEAVPPAADAAVAVVPPPVAARAVQVTGSAVVINPARASRPLALGGPVFEGEQVRTGPDGVAVLAFRDQSKVSVNPGTVMRVGSFRYRVPQRPDAFSLDLLRGGLRTITGLIGKSDPEAVRVRTFTSTIGIRGTGLDISCEGPCVDPEEGGQPPSGAPAPLQPRQTDGVFLYTWQGLTYFDRGPLDVPLEAAGFIGTDGIPRILDRVPDFFLGFQAPRPDTIPVDWDALFAAATSSGSDGLYVLVRDGHVVMTAGGTVLDLAAGEAGYSGSLDEATRIRPPRFLSLDPFPIPESFTSSDTLLLQLFGVTLGTPGQEICRI
jgi:hypothetical protein